MPMEAPVTTTIFPDICKAGFMADKHTLATEASPRSINYNSQVADLLPIFPLEVVLFPGTALPLHIFEPRYKEMIGECLEQKLPFGVVLAKEKALARVGCAADIISLVKT